MESRPLAFAGPAVSRLGLGLAALGRPAYITLGHGEDFPEGRDPEAMQRHAHDVLDFAHAAGITYVDVARSYGRAADRRASCAPRRAGVPAWNSRDPRRPRAGRRWHAPC